MCWIKNFLSSSIGKKQIMGLTGLALCGFLVSHLAGNVLIVLSPEAFNRYAHSLMSNPLILPAEFALLGLFLVHLGLGLRLAYENKKARPQSYAMKKFTGRGANFASNSMPQTGIIILVFLVAHILHFRFGTHYTVTYADGVPMRDLYKLILEVFSQIGYVIWYVFAQIILGIHVSHGFASCFQSLGLNHPRYFPFIRKLSCLYAIVITLGFSFIAVWAHLKGVKII